MKRLVSVAMVFMALWLFMPSIVKAQLYPEWADTYNGANNLDDVAVDLVTVGDTLCVVGYEETSPYPNIKYKIAIRKYGPDGALIAQGQFPEPDSESTVEAKPYSLVKLSNGRLAVGGLLDRDLQSPEGLIVIFDQDLSIHSWNTYEGTRSNDILLKYLAYDPIEDCIYGSGTIADTGSSFINIVVCKYDTNAQPLWSDFPRYDYSPVDVPYGFAIDENGNSYVIARNNGWDVISTVSFDADGNLRWSDVYTGPFYTVCSDLAIDPLGRIHVVGYSGYDDLTALELVYSSSGDSLEILTYPDAYFTSLVFDQISNRYLVGSVKPSGETEYQALVVKANSTGQIQWDFWWGSNPTYSHETYMSVLDDYGRLVLCDKGYLKTGPYTQVFKEYNFLALDTAEGDLVGHPQTLVIEDSSSQNLPHLTKSEAGDIYFCGVKQFADKGLDWVMIKFIPFVIGDPSGDGKLRPNDVTCLVRYLNGDLDIWPPLVVDVNGDCVLDLADVTYFVMYFISGDFPPQYCPINLEGWFLDQIGP